MVNDEDDGEISKQKKRKRIKLDPETTKLAPLTHSTVVWTLISPSTSAAPKAGTAIKNGQLEEPLKRTDTPFLTAKQLSNSLKWNNGLKRSPLFKPR